MGGRAGKMFALTAGFIAMTAFGGCPQDLCDLLPPGPREECLSSPEVSEKSDDTQEQLAVREEPSEGAQPETSAPEPESDGS